jgi:hypothetical protein
VDEFAAPLDSDTTDWDAGALDVDSTELTFYEALKTDAELSGTAWEAYRHRLTTTTATLCGEASHQPGSRRLGGAL